MLPMRWIVLTVMTVAFGIIGVVALGYGGLLLYDSTAETPRAADVTSLFSFYRAYDVLTVGFLSTLVAVISWLASALTDGES